MSGAGAIGGRSLGDPPVISQAQQRHPGRLTANPRQQGQASDVGLHGGAEGVQSKEAQHVEDATIGRTAPSSPAAGGHVGALLNVTHMGGHRVSAAIERGVVPDLPITRGDIAHSLIPLPAEHGGLLASRASCAAAGRDAAAHMLETRLSVDEGGDVAVPPPRGRRADQDTPQRR
ncbi:hypothetical protein [Rathayibacter rathayi]|uniref:hypothetical protein n=1 Tax=Rathayibacter rathayi TaxID=33887 RepID=UPI0011B0CC98|nr:hypothetical protein [Rathayibacter rathayi]